MSQGEALYIAPNAGQAEQPTKFCQSGGLELADHLRRLENQREAAALSEEQMRRER